MPTSVLLAVLAAAGLLALAPALVRRYDATERLVGGAGAVDGAGAAAPPPAPYRARTPTGQPRRRSSWLRAALAGRSAPVSGRPTARPPAAAGSPGGRRAAAGRRPPATPRPSSAAAAVFAGPAAAQLIELVGVAARSAPASGSASRSPARCSRVYLVHLRNRALAGPAPAPHRGPEAAWLAARQAEVRREQARRAAARREAQRRLARPEGGGTPGGDGPGPGPVRPAGGRGRRLGVVPPRRRAARARVRGGRARLDVLRLDAPGSGSRAGRADLLALLRPGTGRGAVAQSGSAPRSHRGGQGFKSPQLHPRSKAISASEMAFFDLDSRCSTSCSSATSFLFRLGTALFFVGAGSGVSA